LEFSQNSEMLYQFWLEVDRPLVTVVPGLPPPALHLLADHLETAAVVDDGDHIPGREAEWGPLPEVADLVLLDGGTVHGAVPSDLLDPQQQHLVDQVLRSLFLCGMMVGRPR